MCSGQKEKGFRVGHYLCAVTNKMGGSRIYNTGCRALLVKLGLGEENTSVTEKVFTANTLLYSIR